MNFYIVQLVGLDDIFHPVPLAESTQDAVLESKVQDRVFDPVKSKTKTSVKADKGDSLIAE